MNLALRGGGWPFGLEKWYVDTLLPDGSVIIVYLARMRVLGVPLARFTAELFRPGEAVVRGSAVARGARGEGAALRFGPCSIDGERIWWTTRGLSGDLRFVPRCPSATLLDPFLSLGLRRLLWSVEVPDADVSGRVWWPGGERLVRGRGYRDRVWFDLLPWRFPIRRLVWGRAAAGPHACTWVEAATADGVVAARWQDGRVSPGDAAPPPLGPSRVILETRVADIDGLRLGWMRGPLRRLTGDPREVKRAGPAEIDGETGVSIHEVVEWG